ncbi:prostatic acid phosphatase-like [Gordionus sp. m RMFG-2023]|uniref:prostatic acid phosphatase-like n=1 Tax=Gordionus sp. m RMFG-2023 TaxID=3053472 RepID=UPI0031FC5E41
MLNFIRIGLYILQAIGFKKISRPNSYYSGNQNSNDSSIIITNIILRHGERSPVESYIFPNYVFNQSHWPNGQNNLTDNGIIEILETGRLLKNRYANIFKRSLSLLDIKSSSSDTIRTKSSALAFLYGFMGSIMDFITRKKILALEEYDALHITTENDLLLNSIGKCCNHISEFVNTLTIPNSTLANYVYSNKNYYDKVKEHSGFGERLTPMTMLFVVDPLFCDKTYNYSLPDWVTPEVYLFTQNYADIMFGLIYKDNANLLKWSIGLLTNKIFCNMLKHFDSIWMNTKYPWFKNYLICHEKNITDNIEDPKSIHMFSAHDITIAGIMSMFQIEFDSRPRTASAFMVELWKYSNPTYSANISSFNSSNDNWIYSTDPYVPFIYYLKFIYKTERNGKNVINNLERDIRFEIAIQMGKDKLVATVEDALITCKRDQC